MNWLGSFFHSQKQESVALIDIGAKSVAGSYALFSKNERPMLLYTKHIPIHVQDGATSTQAMLWALQSLCETLVREGAPTLSRLGAQARISKLLVSIDTPWENTKLRVKHLQEHQPFAFTRALVSDVVQKGDPVLHGERVVVDRSIVGTVLNGYPLKKPYDKKIRRASILYLTSSIEESTLIKIKNILASLYCAEEPKYLSGISLRYQAMRIAFPHEQDILAIDMSGFSSAFLLVRKGLLAGVLTMPDSARFGSREWSQQIERELKSLSEEFPLPDTLFLITREEDAALVKEAMESLHYPNPRLRGSKPKMILVQKKYLSSFLTPPVLPTDNTLLLMALYYQVHCLEAAEIMHTSGA